MNKLFSVRDKCRKTPMTVAGCFLALAVVFGASPRARAQGCIIAHSFGEVGGPTNQGGYLQPHHWEVTIGYRHQYSFRHYVGSEYQRYREVNGSNVRNRINLMGIDLTYQINRRWSADVDVPFEFASRQAYIAPGVFGPGPARFTDQRTSGMGDVSAAVHRWMWDPSGNPHHNIQLGIGLEFPTGQDNIMNRYVKSFGAAPTDNIADYSIQPGIGVWGIPFSLQSFQTLGPQVQLYLNGSYLATLQESNGVPTGHSDPLTAYVSPGDEYLVQSGITYSFKSVRGLSFLFGPRVEGVRSHDLFTGNIGWRRPGFAVSLEPGFQYLFHNGSDLLSVSIARALYVNRTRSVPDTIEGGHGDAAFANYVWLASYVHRF